jgi:hypothetical protein
VRLSVTKDIQERAQAARQLVRLASGMMNGIASSTSSDLDVLPSGEIGSSASSTSSSSSSSDSFKDTSSTHSWALKKEPEMVPVTVKSARFGRLVGKKTPSKASASASVRKGFIKAFGFLKPV